MALSKRIGEKEYSYVIDVLRSEFKSSSGSRYTKKLESAFAKRFGVNYAISFVNGTATMHAALEAYGIGIGDEVIVPPLTMSATTFAVLQANATPVFADVDPDTFQICPESIRERITDRTKAIIPVALYGLTPEYDEINSIAKKRGIKVIEDNAECFLGYYKDRLAGSLGNCASFSFQSSKHLTSGEGGILLTNDFELATRVRRVQSLGYAGVGAEQSKITKSDIQSPEYSRHVCMGWNYRMPELCAAVALGQLENIDELVNRRRVVAEIFHEASRDFHQWFRPQANPKHCVNSYWTWACKISHDKVGWDDFRSKFAENGGDGVYSAWKLTYLEPMFTSLSLLGRERFISSANLERYREGLCPNAEILQKRIVQFKTNYWQIEKAEAQAMILRKTLAQLE
jgi:perosamine synthetase